MSRRAPGTSSSGSALSWRSMARTIRRRSPRYVSTVPITRAASPSAKRPSRIGTSSKIVARMRPLRSASSSTRNGAPCRVRRRSLRSTANTASTSCPSTRSRISGRERSACTHASVCARARPGPPPRPPSGATIRQRMAATSGTATIRAFRGLRYAAGCEELSALVTPPYDVIDAAEHARLLARSPHNAVRLILPPDDSAEAARDLLCAWQDAGVLVEETEACLYHVEQEFTGPDGVRRTRSGFIGLVRVEDYDARSILPARAHARRPRGGTAAPPAHDPHPALADLPALPRPVRRGRRRPARPARSGPASRRHGRRRDAASRLARPRPGGGDRRGRRGRPRRDRRRPPPLRDGGALPAERPDDDRCGLDDDYFACAESSGLEIFPTHRAIRDVPAETRERLPEAALGGRLHRRRGGGPRPRRRARPTGARRAAATAPRRSSPCSTIPRCPRPRCTARARRCAAST